MRQYQNQPVEWTIDMELALRRHWDEGISQEGIAARLGIGNTAVRNKIKKLNWPQRAPRAWSPAEDAILREGWSEGTSIENIGLDIGRSKQSVSTRAGLLGLPPRASAWSSSQDQRLKELWTAGWSGSQIARDIGCTKNAVLGRARRLALPPRQSPIKPARKPVEAHPSLTGPKTPETPAPSPCEPRERPVRRPCQWIHGEPTADPDICGKPAAPGRPYCPEHCSRAYTHRARDGRLKRLPPEHFTLLAEAAE